MRLRCTERKTNCLTSQTSFKKQSWYAPARKIAYYCTRLCEVGFANFETKEKEAVFLLLAETVFFAISNLTISFVTQKTTKRYSPQGSSVVVRFGGGATTMSPFQDIADQLKLSDERKRTQLPAGVSHSPGANLTPPKEKKKTAAVLNHGKF
jgi:hypothetical protein